MNTDYGFSNNFLNKYDLGGYSTGQFNYASGSYAKRENSNITIITNDGDRVTISSDKSVKSTYSSYISLLHSGTSSAGLEGYEYQSQMQGEFSMSIVGDLDSEEYKDIISALATIDSVMKSASSGNMVDLQATAEKFGKLDSLSGLSASIQVEETMRYSQVLGGNKEIAKAVLATRLGTAAIDYIRDTNEYIERFCVHSNIKCPWGCNEFLDECGTISLYDVIRHFIPGFYWKLDVHECREVSHKQPGGKRYANCSDFLLGARFR